MKNLNIRSAANAELDNIIATVPKDTQLALTGNSTTVEGKEWL